MTFRYPLMRNNLMQDDLLDASRLLQQNDPKLTSGPRVLDFEIKWSEWLGVKYSIFVNSGSSANLLAIAYLRLKFPNGGRIIVPPLTWSSDISSIIWLGFEPLFVDISLNTLGLDNDLVLSQLRSNSDICAVFITHAQGLNALTDELIDYCDTHNVFLIEDVCESHGVLASGEVKAGCFGDISCFSFYYAHHMSTIEGGMLSTNDFDIYQQLLLLRGHGLLRESTSTEYKQQMIDEYSDLHSSFIFPIPGFNVRNNELGALIGLSQLSKLDHFISIRRNNFELFLDNLPDWAFTNFELQGQSNYAFNLILNHSNAPLFERLISMLNQHSIEFRRGSAGGGNQLRQPYVRKFTSYSKCQAEIIAPVADHVHFYGLYIGNFPDLDRTEIDWLISILNKV